jgi:probable rRNA maturation factor
MLPADGGRERARFRANAVSKPPSATLLRKRRREKKVEPLIDVIVQSPRWKIQPRAATVVRKAIAAAAKAVSTPHAELAILLADDSAIRALNREWRKLDAPTNVLSFPAKVARASHDLPRHLGDIVIAYETTAREAATQRKPFGHHLVHLAVHGYLHLLGYDHATDREAKKMERLEVDILARLGVSDPYVTRDRAV